MKTLFPITVLAVFGTVVASGQTQDTSGNGMLSGKTYRFRHVAVLNIDENGNPTEIAASYGTINFGSNGNYTITGSKVDNTVSSGAPQPLNVTGTYAIGSNGAGYVANPLSPTDPNTYIYGAVAQGVYTGSSTEVGAEEMLLNDIFVAIPGTASSAPTNASFTSPYQTGLIDFDLSGGSLAAVKNALFELSPNGKGQFGTISVSGQASNQTASSLSQSVTGATYNFNSDGSATLTIPLPQAVSSTNALFTGSKTLYQSADGNFVLGWTASGFDIFFGVKALAITGTNSSGAGLYFTAALENSPSGFGTDSYYGATNNTGDASGDAIVHQRLNIPGFLSEDYGTDDQINLNSDGTTGPDTAFGYSYIFGDGGSAFVAVGTNGSFSLVVGMHAPSFSGPGVYLNPIGVVNAASYQPITASLAPGELIDLYGTGLTSVTMAIQGGQVAPTTMGGVSVTIDGIPCPILSVSVVPGAPSASVIVPYEVASNQTGLANIQVTNNGVPSNVVQMYLTDAAPGSFSQNEDGIGFAAAIHAATGALVGPNNPAQPGEYISIFLTGLGTVTPPITDGGLGPSSPPLSQSDVNGAGNLFVFFDDYNIGSLGNQGAIEFAGLAPGFAGLYQINVQVPTSGLGDMDDVYVEFVTDAADVNQIQIPYGSSADSSFRKMARPLGGSNAVRSRQILIKRLMQAKPIRKN